MDGVEISVFCSYLPFTLRKLEIHIIILHDSNLDSLFVFDFLKPDLPPSGLDLSLGRRPFSRKSVHTLTTYHPDFALVLNQRNRMCKQGNFKLHSSLKLRLNIRGIHS